MTASGTAGSEPLARVLDAVDAEHEGMLDLLVDLVRIPSISGSDAENDVQARLARVLDAAGTETDHWRIPLEELSGEEHFPGTEVPRREAWGLVGTLPGNEGARSGGQTPTLLLEAHCDVVPPGDLRTWTTGDPWSGRVEGGAVYGRGTCDMKAGLVAAVWAVRAVRRSGVRLRGDLLLASVQGEEDGGMGAYALLRRGYRADACVIPEPTGLDLVPANAGALTFRLWVPGRAAHASRRLEGISAIEKFWPVWRALEALERRRNTDVDPLAARWRLPYAISVGVLRSGGWSSSVPDSLVAEGRMGVALDEPVAQARTALETAVAEACRADPWLREHPVVVEWWGGQFASGRLPAGSDLLGRVGRAHGAVTAGRTPQVWAGPYGSDLRLLTGLGGIPTLQYGPGDVALAHSPDESVPLAEVLTCARTLAALALDVCG